jgi:HTH-type transcriptional regulator / antitoxin HigA
MATNVQAGWRPDWAIPPGEILQEALEERGMSPAELARRMNYSVRTVTQIIEGSKAITTKMSYQLERVLEIPASFWTNLEQNYQAQTDGSCP